MLSIDLEDQYTRPIWQIALKTIVTHGLALVAYGQFNDLLSTPKKHNARLFRLITFASLPTVLLGQFASDLLRSAVRILQNPDEIAAAPRFFFDGLLGVRVKTDADITNDGQEATREKDPVRLLDLRSVDSAHHKKSQWNLARTTRIGLTLLIILQATGVIITFARRAMHRSVKEALEQCPGDDVRWKPYGCQNGETEYLQRYYSHSLVGMDLRNLYHACAGFIAAVLSLYLIIAGNEWTWTPSVGLLGEPSEEDIASSTNALGAMGEMKRLLLDFIIGGVIQEFIAVMTYYDSDDGPKYITCLIGVFDHIRLSVVEWVLIVLAVGMIVIFRNDVATRLGIKLRVIYTLLIAVLAGWLMLDTILLLVTDLGHFLIGNYGYDWKWGETWQDPIEWWVPII